MKPRDAVGGLRDDGLCQFLAEPLQEVGHEEIGGAVVSAVAVRTGAPGIQLCVWMDGVAASEVQIGRISGYFLREFAQPFVDPRFLVAVVIPVDHVLKLMSEDGLIVGKAVSLVQPVQIDIEHLLLIGEGIGNGTVEVGAGEVTCDAAPQAGGVEDVQAGVVVDSGARFFAEEFAYEGVDGLGEDIGGC